MTTFYLAVCMDCEPPLPMPFYDESERDGWAAAHRTIGHRVEVHPGGAAVTTAEHIRVAEPAPPVWEYRAVSDIKALNAAGVEGWRLHTAVPWGDYVQYVLERERP